MTEDKNSQPRQLKRELSFFDLIIIGIVGAVGTGILFSAAGMTAIAGPGSWLAWVLGGVFYLFIGLTYSELVATYPEAGGPSRYVLYTHGWFNNTVNSLADLIWYLFIPPIEALAVVEGIGVFNSAFITSSGGPSILGGLVAAVLLVLFVPFNYFGVKAFGKSTVYFGIVKLFFYIAVGVGLAATFYNGANLGSYNGFLPFGFSGVFLAIPLAMFAFGGIRVLPDYAEETKKFRKLPLAIILVVIGQLLIYLFLDWIFVTGIDWSRIGLAAGDWAGISTAVSGKNPFIFLANSYNAPLILGITLIIGIIGPFITGYVYLGGGSRVLFAQGRTRIMPNIIKYVHEKYSIPYWSLLILALIGAILAFISAPIPSIYGLIDDAVVAGYIGFAVNPVALVVTRMQGATRHRVLGNNVLATIVAAVAFVSASLIIFWSGWKTVLYSVEILTAGVVLFGLILPLYRNSTKRDLKHVKNSLWYLGYIGFMLFMTGIGSDGAFNSVGFYIATAIVVAVSVLVFFPLGILSGLKKKLSDPDYQTVEHLPSDEATVLQ